MKNLARYTIALWEWLLRALKKPRQVPMRDTLAGSRPAPGDDHHITTATGRQLRPFGGGNSIHWLDVAVGTSNVCRFGGQIWDFMPVSQHLLLVSLRMEELARLAGMTPYMQRFCGLVGLVHDGAEGLGLGDMPSPIKRHPALSGYKTTEKKMQVEVYAAFGIVFTEDGWGWIANMCKRADLELLLTESMVLRGEIPSDAAVVAPGMSPLPIWFRPMAPAAARRAWIRRLWFLKPELRPSPLWERVACLWSPRHASRAKVGVA